jgi:hypothetical protein
MPLSNMASAKSRMTIFLDRGIALFLTKLSRCFLYSFVERNQLFHRSEPREKKNRARSKKGVVGSIGKATPTAPRTNATRPKVR